MLSGVKTRVARSAGRAARDAGGVEQAQLRRLRWDAERDPQRDLLRDRDRHTRALPVLFATYRVSLLF